jgi:hypothetical protein
MKTDFKGHFENSKDSNFDLYTRYAEVLSDFSTCHRANDNTIFEIGNNSFLLNRYLVVTNFSQPHSTNIHSS